MKKVSSRICAVFLSLILMVFLTPLTAMALTLQDNGKGIIPSTAGLQAGADSSFPESDTGITPLSTGLQLVDSIVAYNTASGGSGSLSPSWNGATNILTVTGSLTNASVGLALNINAGVTVDWQATLSGSPKTYVLALSGLGAFNVTNNALIENTGTGGALSVSSVALSVNDNAIVQSHKSGIAIFNDGNSTTITIRGGLVQAENTTAIQSNGTGSVVTVTGGTVTNAAISNINPTINMTAGSGVNIVLSGGLVTTTNTSNTSYVIQTTGDIRVEGNAQVRALAGRAINLVGANSTATIRGNAEVSATTGIAISTATTNPALVPNAKIIVEGGWVYTETGTVAIQTTGVNGDVTVLGGK
ncbi:MAG: hypothetical protein FWD43_04740, partial [Coriobacteriia bacterium]|nr:hypothetical protein [Coriobacteriia bacterium]